MKIFSFLGKRPRAMVTPEDRLQWLRDPLSHPALERMSERDLGDLPFGRVVAIAPCEV